MKPALIVLDIQNIWLDRNPVMKEGVVKRLKTINGAISLFRKNKLPIIVVYHEMRSEGIVPGTKEFEFFPKIEIADSDTKIVKRYPSAFAKTGLEDIVKQEGCDSIVITGVSAGWCVLGTFFGAMDHDIAPYVLRGGLAADKEEYVGFAEEICDATTLEKLDSAAR